jgi:hypothetical protein
MIRISLTKNIRVYINKIDNLRGFTLDFWGWRIDLLVWSPREIPSNLAMEK